ncbi:MAG: lamin tail domain-containing protein, partial [Bacteroidota bacterium]|nr:lamin tail domain-containing protein [Bacteroidota bacterium]
MKNLFSTLIISIACILQINAQILINEYTGANYDTYTDNYGEYEDWIELYNPTSAAIDINGWYLTDKPLNPTKWMIPSSFVVPANGVV